MIRKLISENQDPWRSFECQLKYQFYDFPFWITKLLIPTVSNYKTLPGGFLYSRSLTLNSFLYWICFERLNYKPYNLCNFYCKKLTKLFGEVNKQSALDYQEQVKNALMKP